MKVKAQKDAREGPDRAMPLLVAVLALALGGVYLSWRLSNPARPAVPPPTAAQVTTAGNSAAEVDRLVASVRSLLEGDAEVLDVAWRPVVVPAAVEEAVSVVGKATFKLKGVARDGQHPVAFIDNRTVALGEEVAGYKLVEIGVESVTLLDPDGQRHEVKLYGGE